MTGPAERPETILPPWLTHWLPLLLVVGVAAALRLPLLDSLPPGLHFDEGGEGIAALDVSRGHLRIMWPIGGGKEPLMAYLVQPLFWLFGSTRLALRLYAALWGIGTVLATYFLAAELLRYRQQREGGAHAELLVILAPALAAFGLATAFWHVAYSRIGFRALSNPAVVALSLGFLWRGLRTNRWRDFLWAGFFTGGLIYTYLVGRFVPLAIALFFVVEASLAWWAGQRSLLGRYWRKLAGLVGMALLVFLPLGLFFLFNPAAFVDRAGAVSIFSPQMNQGDFWGTLWRSAGRTLGTFVALTGDPNQIANLPGRPALSPLLAGFFLLGLGLTLRRWRSRPYLFLLLWWPVMLLPGILAPEGAPHHLRLIGAAAGTYFFVALGLAQLAIWGAQWLGGRQPARLALGLGAGLLVLVFGWTGWRTYQDYFDHWANDLDHYMAFDVYAEELADQIAAETAPVVYLIPMDLRAAHEARHYSLDFLYRGETPYSYLIVDEETLAESLTVALRGAETIRLVRWLRGKHREADEKELVAFLLETAGAVFTGRQRYPAYAVETYRLPGPGTEFDFPDLETPVDVTLDGLIQVRRATVLPALTANGHVAVAITVAPLAQLETDYKASLRLVGPDGTTVAQKDRLLRHNWHQGTSLWPREEVNEYYLLAPPADSAPGTYQVRLVIYHPDSQAPLTADGQVEVPLGTVEIGR